ncbi:MAG: SBBP repeat-containing protein [bacterium]
MKKKIWLGAMLLLGGLAQAQPQDQWPQGFSFDNKPTLLAEPMRHDTDEEVFTSSQNSVLKMQAQQTAGVPQRVWVARYTNVIDGQVCDIVVDAADEVYVAVDVAKEIYITRNSKTYVRNFLTLKYGGAGVKQWEAYYDGPPIGRNIPISASPRKIVADFDNHIYVAGQSASFNYSYATLKYNFSGDRLWASHYAGKSDQYGYHEYPTDFVVDNAGNVYVTGRATNNAGITEFATVKYDKTGKERWVASYHRGSNLGSSAWAMALDRAGNICVTGTSADSNKTDGDYTTIKYKPNGKMQWVTHYKGPYNAVDRASALAIDAAGNVYVTGLSTYAATTVKYNAVGVQQWVASYPLPNYLSNEWYFFKLWVDEAENVYLGGRGMSIKKYILVKYNKAGALEWVANYIGNGGQTMMNDMTLDRAGNIYVTGSSLHSTANRTWDYVTIKYNSTGQMQWLVRYNGPANGDDCAEALAVDGSGNVYVTGISYGGNQFDVVTIKYSQNLSNVSESAIKLMGAESAERLETNLPSDFYLAPNYPNPFNPSTSIRFGVPQAAHVTLKVYNLLSEEVATLVDEQKPAGVHVVNFTPKDLPSGIYFYALTAGDVRLVQRMVYAK